MNTLPDLRVRRNMDELQEAMLCGLITFSLQNLSEKYHDMNPMELMLISLGVLHMIDSSETETILGPNRQDTYEEVLDYLRDTFGDEEGQIVLSVDNLEITESLKFVLKQLENLN